MSLLTVRQKTLLTRILAVYHPEWASRAGSLESLAERELTEAADYLERVVGTLGLFIPGVRHDFGITERGGDAVVAYFTGKERGRLRRFFMMLDVSGFTALLTFLTDRFGKQEAGDIMNLSILNRYCLDKIGLLVHYFGSQDGEFSTPGEKALKVALSFRAQLARVTDQVRRELSLKLAGKPHQETIIPFIRSLQIKASGSVVAAAGGRSDFYGKNNRVRITWGQTARRVAAAEKVGGSDQRVDPKLAECKGVGLDSQALEALKGLLEKGWLRKGDFRLRDTGRYRKLVLTPRGQDRLLEQVDGLLENYRVEAEESSTWTGVPAPDKGRDLLRIRKAASSLEELLPFLYGVDFIELVVSHLDSEGDRRLLFADRSSRIHETGILFTNFTVSGSELLDELAELVHEVTSRYGLICKYNIFPRGDFNLMAVLGLGASGAQAANRFYAEILWQCWRDLVSGVERAFRDRVCLRSGMSVGKCLQGPVGDNLIHNELTVIGPDCNLAARLLARALTKTDGKSGTMVLTKACYGTLGHLVQPVESFERAHLKGFSDLVPLYSASPRKENESLEVFIARLRQLPLVTTDGVLVDQQSRLRDDRCLAACLDYLEAVERGKRAAKGVLAFTGESGLGKTRRMAELMQWGLNRGWTVLYGECLSWYQGTGKRVALETAGAETRAVPYHPFIRILNEQVFDILPHDTASAALEKIRQAFIRLSIDKELLDQVPIVGSYLGIAVPEGKIPVSLSPLQRRNIFFERVAEIFERIIASRGKGLLLSVDDLQWADQGSLKLLQFLRQRIGEGLVICAGALHPGNLQTLDSTREEERKNSFRPFELQPLKRRGAAVLARAALGLKPEAGLPGLLDKRIGELENNPLFIIEFCRKLLDTEVVFVRDGKVQRIEEEALSGLSVPNRVHSVIEELINSLPKQDFDLIRHASILGNTLRCRHVAELYSRLTGDSKTELSGIYQTLHRLAGGRVLEIEQDRGPDSVYKFSRSLIALSLYQGLPPSLRKRLHGLAAEIFQKSREYSPQEKTLACALHYELAERPQEACGYYLDSAHWAGELFENERALKLLNKVERFCGLHHFANGERMLLDAYGLRGNVALALGHYGRSLEDCKKAERLALRLNDPCLAGKALLVSGKTYLTRAQADDFRLALSRFRKAEGRLARERLLVFEARNGQARVLLETGRLSRARENAEIALRALESVLDSRKLSEEEILIKAGLLRTMGTSLLRMGKHSEALAVYDQALDLVERRSGSSLLQIKAMLINSKALGLASSFRLAEALDLYYQAKSTARRVGDINLQIVIMNNMSVALNDSGQNAKALDLLLSRYKSLVELAGENRSVAGFEFNVGESYHFMENYSGAERHYRRALEIARKIGSRQFEVNVMYNLGESINDQGRREEACLILGKGLRIARSQGYRQQEIDLENLLGEIERDRGKLRRALRRHKHTVSVAQELGDLFGRSWSLRNLAVDLLTLGNPADLKQAREMIFTSLELSRKAVQPENTMETLRRILEFAGPLGLEPGERRSLLRQLQELAGKQESKKYLEFCSRLAGALTTAGDKQQ
ncbi:MAG TPA: AAA family ATPase [archaeon]|nr:AAA family ATPase [archaeon]